MDYHAMMMAAFFVILVNAICVSIAAIIYYLYRIIRKLWRMHE